jgi:hypothetical protein
MEQDRHHRRTAAVQRCATTQVSDVEERDSYSVLEANLKTAG